MEVNFCVADHAALIERVLDGFIQAAELLYKSGAAKGPPSITWELQDDGNPEVWKLPTQVEEDGVADCEDLVIAWAGWLRATGEDPGAGARIATVGPKKVHCLLKRGSGEIVDIWEIHRKRQEQFQMSGLWGAIKKGAQAVGKGAQAVGRGVKTVGRGVKTAAVGVKKGAQYVAKDLPGKVLKEGAEGIEGLVRGVGGAGSTVINAVGDVVAQGASDALGQWGKLGREIMDSVSSEPAAEEVPPAIMPPGYDPYGGGYGYPADTGGGGFPEDMGDDPWGDAGIDDPWGDDPWGAGEYDYDGQEYEEEFQSESDADAAQAEEQSEEQAA